MPHRDPQTGQFLGDAASTDYSDFDIQQSVTMMDTDDANVTDKQQVFDQFHSVDPVGGLSRDEVAELVLAIIDVSLAVPTHSGTGTASVEISSEFSADSTPHLLPILADDVSETDVDGIAGVDARNVSFVDPDQLWSHTQAASADDADTTNGVGLGGSQDHTQRNVPYRAMFGHGPEFDRHSELFWHLGYQASGSTNPGFRYVERVTLVWDVYEEE